MGACTFDAGDTCDGDVCINHAPVAVISGLSDDGALRVGGVGEVLISARDSNDPDGDALTFAWSATEPCASAVSGALDTQELRLLDLPIGATCEVALTVTDARGLSASATATLIVRNIGGYVAEDAPCVTTFDITSEDAQGTAASPFCSVAEALLAANALHLAEVSLEQGSHRYAGIMAIDFPVRVRGGYQRSDNPWVFSLAAGTTLVLEQGSASVDATIVASGAVTLAIADLMVRRSGACNDDCALVSANDASLELRNVTLGSPSPSLDANSAPGRNYTSVLMTAQRAQNEVVRRLVMRTATINGSANANSSIGVQVSGPIDVDLEDVLIRESALVSAGVRSIDAGAIRVKSATMEIRVPRVDGSRGFGVIDGDRDVVSLASCNATGVVTCRASASLTVEDSAIEVSGGDDVLGISAFGTSQVRARNNILTLDGQKASGILTSRVNDVQLESQIVTATTQRVRSGISAYAVGYSDSYETTGDLDGGSSAIQVIGSTFDVRVNDDNIEQAAGINLVHSRNVTATDAIVRVGGLGPLVSGVGNVAGIRMLSVDNVRITGGSVTVEGLKATERAAGIADGQPVNSGIDPVGSRDIFIRNVSVRTAVAGDLNTLNACVMVLGAETVHVTRDRDSAAVMECAASGPSIVAGIYSAANHDVQVKSLEVVVAAVDMITGVFGATHVGIHDGGILQTVLDRASTQLLVSGNLIRMNEAGRTQIGVRVRGHVVTGLPIVSNNVILGTGSTSNVGVLIHAAEGTVALNSIRLQGCTPCAAPIGVGVYVMHADAYSSKLAGNAISTTSGMDPQYRPAFVRHSTGPVVPNIGAVDYNLYHSETGGSEAPLLAAAQNLSTDILTPAGMTAYAEDAVAGVGNMPTAADYCPDGVHGAPTGDQVGAAVGMTNSYGLDIDGEERELASLDIGADRIGAACP